MAKLINILAASVGSGLMLGAGIRLGEALAGHEVPPRRDNDSDGILAARIGAIEGRLRQLEAERPGSEAEQVPAFRSSVEKQAAEVDAKLKALGETSLRLRAELQNWLENSVTTRMADVESRLKAESEQSQKQLLDTIVEGVQTRVMNRIARLENELASQSSAMTELRECSIRTEQSMQKLLGGIDRLIVAQQPAPANADNANVQSAASQDTAKNSDPSASESDKNLLDKSTPTVELESNISVAPRSRRWGIFG